MTNQDAMSVVANPIEILHITDPHILKQAGETLYGADTASSLERVLQQATAHGQDYDLCLITGDLVQQPTESAYTTLLSILDRYWLDFSCLPGNHDDPALMCIILNTAKVNCKKQHFLGNWQIVCLNSSAPNDDGGLLARTELEFLERCLRENPGLFTLVAVHHHCLPTGSRWMDTMLIDNAGEFLGLLGRYPQVKGVINGHIHQQMDVKINGLRILSTPSTCFQFVPHSPNFKLDRQIPAYRRLTLYPEGTMDTEVVLLPELCA
jgi:3',5'-cyclic-AMP phosphodiesterase